MLSLTVKTTDQFDSNYRFYWTLWIKNLWRISVLRVKAAWKRPGPTATVLGAMMGTRKYYILCQPCCFHYNSDKRYSRFVLKMLNILNGFLMQKYNIWRRKLILYLHQIVLCHTWHIWRQWWDCSERVEPVSNSKKVVCIFTIITHCSGLNCAQDFICDDSCDSS